MRLAIMLIVFIAASAICTAQTTWYVPDEFSTIQGAISDPSVLNGDTVIVRPGTYVENIDFLGKAITVESEMGSDTTVIDGGNPSDPNLGSTVLFQNDEGSDSVIQGFTIMNGTGTYYLNETFGGGIFCVHSSPTICNNIITMNIATRDGGGVGCYTASPVIMNNVISDNIAHKSGGGIGCHTYSNPMIIYNVISLNKSASVAGGGGGITYITYCDPIITNNIIHDNTSDKFGGGIYVLGNSTGTNINNTITSNYAALNGGGIAVRESSTPNIYNCIVYNNDSSDNQEIYVESSNISINYSNIKGGWSGTGNIDTDPLYYDPTNGDYHLQQDPCQPNIINPCVDAGDPGSSMIEGSTRSDGIQDANVVDMGYHYPISNILHVPSEYSTIQSGINAANDGDTVLVAPGTYFDRSFRDKAYEIP